MFPFQDLDTCKYNCKFEISSFLLTYNVFKILNANVYFLETFIIAVLIIIKTMAQISKNKLADITPKQNLVT